MWAVLIILFPVFVIAELLKGYDGKGARGRKGRRR
jgi:hypothetical protein